MHRVSLPSVLVTKSQAAVFGRDNSPLTELESDTSPPPKQCSRPKARHSSVVDRTVSLTDSEVPKKIKTRNPKEQVIYEIPPVETKETTFKGRLGYVSILGRAIVMLVS